MITGGISGIWSHTRNGIWPSGLQQAGEFDMFRRLQIYSPYLQAKRKAGLLSNVQVWLLLSSWKTPGADGQGSGLDLSGAR